MLTLTKTHKNTNTQTKTRPDQTRRIKSEFCTVYHGLILNNLNITLAVVGDEHELDIITF